MVFSMNVFTNKKRWQNKKKTFKNVKKRALNKKRKKRFFTSMQETAIYCCTVIKLDARNTSFYAVDHVSYLGRHFS